MGYRLFVRPEVDTDLLAAEAWYESQQTGLGRQFLQAVRASMAGLSQNPLTPRIRHRSKQIRWIYPHRFPYRIVYRVINDTVVIYAVLHAARRERFWKRRI